MKRLLALALFVSSSACGLYAQVVDTTVCDIVSNPQSFDGKMVRIKGTVVAGLDQFVVKGADCKRSVNAIWLTYPEKTKGKAGPVAIVQLQAARNYSGKVATATRPPIVLDKSKDFKQFDSLASTPHISRGGMCLGCARYEVGATLVGRLDGVADASMQRDSAGKIVGLGGFGNMNAYPARLVLQSVSDVTPKEIDYSKTDVVVKGRPQEFGGNGNLFDPIEGVRKSAENIPGEVGVQVKRAADAFPQRGADNGVLVGFGATNEVAAKGEAQGAKDSPDGVLYNCAVNLDRLQGDPLLRALIHLGEHIADSRTAQAADPKEGLFDQEYRAWMIASLAAYFNRQSSLTMPGGYQLWDASWAPEDRTKIMDETLVKFLTTEAGLAR